MYKRPVERGMRWLNRHYGPDWYKEIDLDILKMSNASRCILGQLYGNYYSIKAKNSWSFDQAAGKGFTCNTSWEALNATWEEAILTLRGEINV